MAHDPLDANKIQSAHDVIIAAASNALAPIANATGLLQTLLGLVFNPIVVDVNTSVSVNDAIVPLEQLLEKIVAAGAASTSEIASVVQAINSYNQRADAYLDTVTTTTDPVTGVESDPTTDSRFQEVNTEAEGIYSQIDQIYSNLSGTFSSVILQIDPAPPVAANVTSSVAIDIRNIVIAASKKLSIALAPGTRSVLTSSQPLTSNPEFDELAAQLTDLDNRLDPINAVKEITSTADTATKITAFKTEVESATTVGQTGKTELSQDIPQLVTQLSNLTF